MTSETIQRHTRLSQIRDQTQNGAYKKGTIKAKVKLENQEGSVQTLPIKKKRQQLPSTCVEIGTL